MAYQFPATAASNERVGAYRDPRVSFVATTSDKFVTCVYDKSHTILSNKIVTHLVKCRHNYMNAIKSGKTKVTDESFLVICPYNAVHHLPQGDMEYHLDYVCQSNPFTKDDFFQRLDNEKLRRDKIAEEEKREAKVVVVATDDSGIGDEPYWDEYLSRDGSSYGSDSQLEFQPRGQYENHERPVPIRMGSDDIDVKPHVGGFLLSEMNDIPVHIKQEQRRLRLSEKLRRLDIKEEPVKDTRRSRITPGAVIAANLMKIKKEEEQQPDKENLEWVRPGEFGDITTPCRKYKNQAQNKKQVVYDEQGLTEEQQLDPEFNWELDLEDDNRPLKRFMSYDPTHYLTRAQNENKTFIQNPQGLTKSERVAYHKKRAEEERRREEERDAEAASVAGRAAQNRMEREMDKLPAIPWRALTPTRGRSEVLPTFPGFELDLDMQQNPMEKYDNWHRGASSCDF